MKLGFRPAYSAGLSALLSLLLGATACNEIPNTSPEGIEGIGGQPVPGRDQPCVPDLLAMSMGAQMRAPAAVADDEGSGDEEEQLCDRDADPEGCVVPDDLLKAETQEDVPLVHAMCIPYPYPSLPIGKEQSVGSVSAGSLLQAAVLPKEAPGFLKISEFRNRGYGSSALVNLILKAAVLVANAYPDGERLQIADLSGKNGGDITLHASHENGTDADGFYFRRNHKEQHPDYSGFEETFVWSSNGKLVLSENFDVERNWALMKALVNHGKVGRIFADQVIKNAFCAHAKKTGELTSQAETLRRIRHWANHRNHFHVRIKCPADSPRCINQAELPQGSGC